MKIDIGYNPLPTNAVQEKDGHLASIDTKLTSPITVTDSDLLSIYKSSTATITATASITTVSAVVIKANANRKGLLIYNNSSNSIYLAFAPTANSNTNMTLILATFAAWTMPFPIYTGIISGIRNAGTGTCLVTELT